MVFPSVPVYLDHSSWLQQQAGDSVIENLQLTPVPPSRPGQDGDTVVISMSERARLAKLPYPEAPLKCPRCESTNTKFCYFNNYSLSQPRHYCKTCRRYWTRGGALRDVPVGGGCRRSTSKKSKGSRSKSPITSTSTTSTPISSNTCSMTNKFVTNSSMYSNLPIFPSLLPNVPELSNAGGNELGFPIDKTSASTGTLNSPAAFSDQWMSSSHQLNLSSRFDQPVGAYNFEREAINPLPYDDQVGFGQLSSSLKQEENQGSSLSRNYMRLIPGINDQYWSGNYSWRDLSATSSASHFM